MYQGHLPDGSSVQRHSAGGLYPYVVASRENNGQVEYGLIGGSLADYDWVGTHDQAVRKAERLLEVDSFKRRARSIIARSAKAEARAFG